MNNYEKLASVGQLLCGANWQSTMAKYLGVSDRTIRNFVAGKTVPDNISKRLIDAINTKHAEAMMIINNDKMNGDEITIDLITEIVDRYEYADSMTREHAIDAINNAIYQETFISDLDAIARKFSV
ncbi:hypothetical protein WP3W18E01_24410 [Raoultella ornithinolytica]|uniref:hypothetical protein n=1 Tax=Klebsiella/Raoultella group TaxID=2890311 RepID=UPI0005DE3C89|nr:MULTISPECIES: hypothetical protein [Klebsiella/Raoultella group]KJG01545.1 hypothetical protein UA70_21980 [Raoultella planticola]APB06088.1 hypothetical protein BK817_14250 [Raoultella ornithinolytica]EKW1876964.1 hypothetical protein [Raoultella ornithinolytica]MCF6685217.1 hypothetical protein [Raoultella ornithinolytica]MCZ0098707.1 hypothetical protein [Raoultella ornithinolytica]